MVLYSIGCFWSVLGDSGRLLPDLWINFSSSAMISMLHYNKDSFRWFLSFQDSFGYFCMVVEGFYTF